MAESMPQKWYFIKIKINRMLALTTGIKLVVHAGLITFRTAAA